MGNENFSSERNGLRWQDLLTGLRWLRVES